VLVIGNQFDPATRYEGAATVAGLLPNSRLLTVHAWGHTSLFLSQCAGAIVSQYFISGALPPSGTICEQDFVPFVQPLSQVAAATTPSWRALVNRALVPDVLLRSVH